MHIRSVRELDYTVTFNATVTDDTDGLLTTALRTASFSSA